MKTLGYLPGAGWLGAAVIAACVLSADTARAQAQTDLPDLQLQRFRPATGPGDYLQTHGSDVAKHLDWHAGLVLDYADDPLTVETASVVVDEVVDFQLTASLMANLGLFDLLEVGLLVPFTALQTPSNLEPINAAGRPTDELPLSAVNDSRLTVKYQLLDGFDAAVGLALVGGLNIPLASDEALSSDRGFGGELTVAADYFIWRDARAALNLGYRYRSGAVEIRDATISDEVLWSVGLRSPTFLEDMDVVLDVAGGIGVARDRRQQQLVAEEAPSEVLAGFKYAVHPDWTLTGGLGTDLGRGLGGPRLRAFLGLTGHWVTGGEWSIDYGGPAFTGDIDQCPDQPEDLDGFQDDDGCPDPDNDQDGVPDPVDACPETPEGTPVKSDGCPDEDIDGDGIPNSRDECPEDMEDLDGFQDDDGCPDPDNDDDGLADPVDECPEEAENFNGFEDEDGCPEEINDKVSISRDKLVITDKVFFETARAQIRPESFPILDAVADVLLKNPQIKRLRIEGHTDDQGSEGYNEQLSQRRAESVRDYIIDAGVQPERLVAIGYGEAQPIADNATAEGRSENRRVDFTILGAEDSDTE